MKSTSVIIVGFILSLICMLVYANVVESGDVNAISMYFVVFFLPVVLMVVINAIYLKALNTIPNKTVKCILGLVPPLIFVVLCFREELTIPGLDANLIFLIRVCAVSIGITDLMWIAFTLKDKVPGEKIP